MYEYKSRHLLVFTGSLAPEPESCASYFETHGFPDEVVAADSGLETLMRYQSFFSRQRGCFSPSHIVGDMDSISDKSLLASFSKAKVELSPQDKDFSDTELALYKLAENGRTKNDRVTLIGGGGGRVDHLFAIFDIFSTYLSPDVWLYGCGAGQSQALYVLRSGQKAVISGLKEYDYVSVCRTSASWTGGNLETEGLEWGGELFRIKGMPSLSNRISKEYFQKSLPVSLSAYGADFVVILPLNAVCYTKTIL